MYPLEVRPSMKNLPDIFKNPEETKKNPGTPKDQDGVAESIGVEYNKFYGRRCRSD